MERHLMEKAYSCAKSKFKKNYFTFKDLFDALAKDVPSIKNEATDLYIELLQDNRFISLGKQKWALRENFTISEINKITSSMFGLDEYHEEDADQYMSEAEKIELKSKTEKAEEIVLENIEDDEENITKPNIRKLANEEEEDIEKHVSSVTSRVVSELDEDIVEDDEEIVDDDISVDVEDDEEIENEEEKE